MNNPPARLETQMRSVFGFKSLPFAKDLEPDRLFENEAWRHALDRLRYLLDRRGIGALFGAPGTGKSTLLRAFLGGLSKSAYAVCYIADTTCASYDLCRQIARGFQLEPRFCKSDLLQQIKERICKLSQVQKLQTLLVIDDAHLLPAGFLDHLRLLSSFEQDGRDELTLLVAGHPQLESNLRLAVHEAFAQRIVQRVRLRSLHPEEVEGYLNFRLELAGRTARLFGGDAVEAIGRAARGIPRLIDRLAEQSLLIALRDKKKEIDAETVGEAVEEVEP